VRVSCPCGASRHIEPEALARLLGCSTTLKALARRLRCSQCGESRRLPRGATAFSGGRRPRRTCAESFVQYVEQLVLEQLNPWPSLTASTVTVPAP